ncbi:MAG: tRNA (guanosine(46)-N7)-methyltransferase TrmB [Oligoflexia bacterium]
MKNPSPIPLQHPEYRYPPSRNPYSEKLKQAPGVVLSDNETETRRGHWKKEKPGALLHVEIGCNAGHVVTEWAARDPENLFIGIDWKFKAIYRGFEKSLKKNLSNLHLLRAHADRLPFIFGPCEIDRLYLFFPDPWPKKSQLKNRYFTESKLKMIAELMPKGGTFEIKTDHPGYFEWMLDHVSRVPEKWKLSSKTKDLHSNHPNPTELTYPEVTCFEKLFIRDGIKIHQMILTRI